MCDYDTHCYMLLGLIIDGIIMNLFLNQANRQVIKGNNKLFTKTEENIFLLYKRSLQEFQWKNVTRGSIDVVLPHEFFDKRSLIKHHNISSHWNNFQIN